MSSPKHYSANSKINLLRSCVALAIAVAVAGCSTATLPEVSEPVTQVSQSPRTQTEQWRRMTAEQEEKQWDNIWNNPLGIAALHRLAIEEFISPNCPKTFYINKKYGGFQTLLRVKCPEKRGVAAAVGSDQMRVIFNRFESNIESLEVKRINSQENAPITELPN